MAVVCTYSVLQASDQTTVSAKSLFALVTAIERSVSGIEKKQKKDERLLQSLNRKVIKSFCYQELQSEKQHSIKIKQSGMKETLKQLGNRIDSLEDELRQWCRAEESEKKEFKCFVEKRFDILTDALTELSDAFQEEIDDLEIDIFDIQSYLRIRSFPLFSSGLEDESKENLPICPDPECDDEESLNVKLLYDSLSGDAKDE